jgi:hypothetical protein
MNVEIPKVDGHCTFPVFESGPSMRGSFEKVIGEARKSLGPIPTKDSGLNWGVRVSLSLRRTHMFCPKEVKLRRQLSAGHDVGGEHERFGDGNIRADFSLGARADA